MDGNRFDNLSRALSHAASRRSAIRAAVAAVVGGASLAAVGNASAVAIVCRAPGQACSRNDQCCSAYCEQRRTAPARTRNKCQCPAGNTICGNDCADLQTDERHCGACGNACGAGETCCNGACRDLDTDMNHCGSCGKRCSGAFHICEDGICHDPCAGTTGKIYVDNQGEHYAGFKDSDPWGVACSSNDICEAQDRCSGDPDNPCICRKRVCERGKTKTLYASPQCADLDRV
jgi:hypothetical protein